MRGALKYKTEYKYKVRKCVGLSDTEDKISYARQFYNDVVLKYNNACQQFPSNIIAGIFGFNEETFFEAPAEERAVPKVEF